MPEQETLNIRFFNPKEDFQAYVDFLNLASNDAPTTLEQQKEHVELFTMTLEQDRLVVEDPTNSQAFIAVCDIWRIQQNPSADLMLLVHPDWRRQGIGIHLFEAAKQQARQIQAIAIDTYVKRNQKAEKAFVESQGFKLAGNFTAMEAVLPELPKQKGFSSAYKILNYTELKLTSEEKLELLVRASREFWGDLWGHKVSEDIALTRQTMQTHFVDAVAPEHLLFLFHEDSFIGLSVLGIVETDEGEQLAQVDSPAIHPEWRNSKVSSQFALVGMKYLYEKGCRRFIFTSWGESQETLNAYKQFGFKETEYEFGYQLKLI